MAQFYGGYSSMRGNTRTDTTEDCPIHWVYIEGRPHRWALLKVGDIVEKLCAYGHHGATIEITKINRRSIVGTEIEKSYGQGTRWRLGASI
jgi:hypothetical protein